VTYEITHRTTYLYDDVVTASYGQLHLLPGDVDGQMCLDRRVEVEPRPDTVAERVDFFGNRSTVFVVHTQHDVLQVTSRCRVDTSGRVRELAPADHRPWEVVRDTVWSGGAARVDVLARDFALESPMVPALDDIAAYAGVSFTPGRSFAAAVTELVARVNQEFAYTPGATSVDTPLAQVLVDRRGVCQDFAHLLLGAFRSVGLPAAYVSGYIETDPPPGRPRLQGADATHAWVAVYAGDGRWIGLDPTNDQLAGPRYVTTARGRDYSDVPPMKGVIYTNATRSELRVEVDVLPG
jgi:transglutaminase-like putative cysteine protease